MLFFSIMRKEEPLCYAESMIKIYVSAREVMAVMVNLKLMRPVADKLE